MEYPETEEVMTFKGSQQKDRKNKALQTPKQPESCPHRACPFQRDKGSLGEW